jgi:ABC-type uncharacterized transport system permease subunit
VIAFLHLSALAGYLGAWALFFRAFREGGSPAEETGLKLALGAAAVHGLGLALFGVQHSVPPLVGLGPASSTLAFATALLVLAASTREANRPTALFVLPLVVLLVAEAVAVGVRPVAPGTDIQGTWLVVHVGTVFVGYAGLALASAAAAMYVLQFRTLKRKEFGSVFGFFPPLETLDRLNRLALWIGFSFLTAGLVLGWSRTLTYGQGFDLGNPQVIFGVATWAAYLTAVIFRLAPGERAERSAVATASAFCFTAAVFGALRILGDAGGFFL